MKIWVITVAKRLTLCGSVNAACKQADRHYTLRINYTSHAKHYSVHLNRDRALYFYAVCRTQPELQT